MKLRYLLDANVLSEPVRLRPDPGVVEKLRLQWDRCATAAPVWHELCRGILGPSPSRRRKELQDYLASVVRPNVAVLPYDEAAAEWHAAEAERLSAAGRSAPFVDGQVAAIAKVNGLVVVTTNVRSFSGFEGIAVEDWRSR